MTPSEVTFGQLSAWRMMERIPGPLRHEANLVRSWDLPEGLSVPRVEAAVRELVRRHEALRTTFQPTPEGGLRQLVHTTADPLPFRVAAEDGAPDASAARTSRIFDPAAEFAWQATLYTRRNNPASIVLLSHHVVLDAWAMNTAGEELLALLAGRGGMIEQVRQPREIAREQRSQSWQSRRRISAAYRGQLLDRLGAETLARMPVSPTTGTPRAIGVLDTPVSARTLNTAADRLTTSPQSMALACSGLLLCRLLGTPTTVVNLVAANRFSDRDRCVLGTNAQLVPLLIDTDPAESFGAFTARLQARSRRAYAAACYDVDEYAQQREQAAQRLLDGRDLVFDYGFNFQTSRTLAGTRQQARSHFSWAPPKDAGPTFSANIRLVDFLSLVTVSDPDVFDREAVRDTTEGFGALIRAVVDDPQVRVGALPLP